MAGPTIIAHGTDAQKQRYLPPMLRGEEVWCQLFSEPGAGCDLAGLSTRAVRDGDEWVVNGQKVWTSGAHYSDFGILLARTDLDQPEAPRHHVLPGRHALAGHRGAAAAPDDRRVALQRGVPHRRAGPARARRSGEVNGGWGVAMTTLANERTFMGGGSSGPVRDATSSTLAREQGVADDPVVRQGLAASYTRGADHDATSGIRSADARRARACRPDPRRRCGKLFAAWNLKRNGELALAIEGAAGMLADADAPEAGRWQQSFLGAPSIRIAGGSDEIQRNVIGRAGARPAGRAAGRQGRSRSGSCDGADAAVTRRSPMADVDAELSSPEQQERRRRLIDAAFELGAEGGYDAVQMRDVVRDRQRRPGDDLPLLLLQGPSARRRR